MPGAFLKVVLFVAAIVALFVYVSVALTRISGGSGGAAISGEVSVAAGEAIFLGKGKCYTCHSFGAEGSAVRCPNLGVFGETFTEPVGVRAETREEGMSGAAYLVESLYDPNAFVVEGYPKNLMKPINRPPIALSDDEIASVILYLREKSEVDAGDTTIAAIQLAQKPYAGKSAEVAGAAPFSLPSGDAGEGKAAFLQFRCFQCHRIDGIPIPEGYQGGVGPELTSIGSIQTATYIAESIMDPSAIIVADPPGSEPGGEGSYKSPTGTSKMPVFHHMMTVQQLLDITAFVATLTSAEENAAAYGGS